MNAPPGLTKNWTQSEKNWTQSEKNWTQSEKNWTQSEKNWTQSEKNCTQSEKNWTQSTKNWAQLEKKKQNRELFIIVLNSYMINEDILFYNNIFYKTSNSLNVYPKQLIFTRFKKNKSHEIKNTMFNFIQSCNDNGNKIVTYKEIKTYFKLNKLFKIIMALYGKDNGDDIFYFCNHHKNELYAEWDIDYNNIIVKLLSN